MSGFRIELSQQAESYLRRLDQTQKSRIVAKLRELSANWEASSKRLVNRGGARRARVGVVRIVFDVDLDSRTIQVLAIGPRGDIYKRS